MGLIAKLFGGVCVVVVVIAMALRVAPVESAIERAPNLTLDPILSVDAVPPEPMEMPPPGAEAAHSVTAQAVPVRKPKLIRAPIEVASPVIAGATSIRRDLAGIERPAPSGYLDFCHRRPDICTVGGADQVSLTDASWSQLVTINAHYDETIEPKTDQEALGLIEHWDIPSGPHPVGDCEDFALAKKARLMSLGWPRSALLLAVANIPDADPAARRHAVLIVVTDHGNFVLDNRRLKILTWEEAGYDWVSIQSPGDAYKWVAISTDANSRLVTASGVPDITRSK